MAKDSIEAQLQRFINESGFKILALGGLSPCGYSVMLYLLNCAVSQLDQFVTTESELASLIGFDESTLRETLRDLAGKNMLRLHYGEAQRDNVSLRIGLQFETAKWVLTFASDVTSQDAVVFPFRRGNQAALQVFDGQRDSKQQKGNSSNPERSVPSQRIVKVFAKGRNLDDEELEQATVSAKVLAETHPIDQILLALKHFGLRIPTLSLLASSWQHYQEIFEEEVQKVDLAEARQKHQELDLKVQEEVAKLIEQRADLQLTEEEVTVLKILSKHRHPRRQLFWAYQVKARYPNLQKFFSTNAHLMLAVTSGGTVVRKPSANSEE